MPDKTARGRFVWHELMVPDAAKAHEFYGKVVGWTVQPFEQDPAYQMFAASTGPLGGTVAHTDSPAHWLPFLGTTDIDATIEQATQLGATVATPVSQIPNGGRWARLTDPQGAAFAVYQSATKPAREKPPKRGEFSWHELVTTDYQAAFNFYSKVFGWEKVEEHDMGPLGVYFIFGRNGAQLGGMFNLTPEIPGGPAWTGYIRVKGVHKTVKKAKSAGATLTNGPMEVPGGDWIAQFMDPQGATFAVHTLKADLAPPAPTAGAASAPQQGSLDFPPVADAPERVNVVATKQPATKTAKSPAPVRKPSAAKAKKPAAKKPSAKTASAKKSKRPIKQSAARKRAAKQVRKGAPTRKSKKATRKKSIEKASKKASKSVSRRARRGK